MRLLNIALPLLLCTALVCRAATPVLIIEAEDAAPPWSNADGSGYANDKVRAAFAAVGVKIELRTVSYARCKRDVIAGRVAGCLSMAAEPGLERHVQFADQPLYTVSCQIAQRKNTARTVYQLNALPAGSTLALVHGYEYPFDKQKLAQQKVILSNVYSETQGLRLLASGRIDYLALVLDHFKTLDFLQKKAGVNGIELAFEAGSQGSFIGFSKANPNGLLALEAFNRGMKKITAGKP